MSIPFFYRLRQTGWIQEANGITHSVFGDCNEMQKIKPRATVG
jgi:hypothetical protein